MSIFPRHSMGRQPGVGSSGSRFIEPIYKAPRSVQQELAIRAEVLDRSERGEIRSSDLRNFFAGVWQSDRER